MLRFFLGLSLIGALSCINVGNSHDDLIENKGIDLKIIIHQKGKPENMVYLFEVLSDSLTVVDFNKTTAQDFIPSWMPDTTGYKLNTEECKKIASLINKIPYEEDEEVKLYDVTELRIIIDGQIRFHRTAFGRGMPDARSVDELLDLLCNISNTEILLFGYND